MSTQPSQMIQSPKPDLFLESRDLGLLTPELFEKVEILRTLCEGNGVKLVVGTTLRGPGAQAKIWCRSRTPEEVLRQRAVLAQSAPKLANLLKPEYAALGPQITAYLPGQSWHQWGQAADIGALVGGKLVWEGSITRRIAEYARTIGLHHSLNEQLWSPSTRRWHVQLSGKATPLLVRGFMDSWAELERAMETMFEVPLADD